MFTKVLPVYSIGFIMNECFVEDCNVWYGNTMFAAIHCTNVCTFD